MSMAGAALKFSIMHYKVAYPSEKLKPYVKQYWTIRNSLSEGQHYKQRIVPGGMPELILYTGNRPVATTNSRTMEDNFLLNGQHHDFYDLVITKDLSVFSIVFHPHGLSQFFNLPLNAIASQSVPLHYINKKMSDALKCQLTDLVSFEKRIAVIEAYLIKLLAENENGYEFSRINTTVEVIKSSMGHAKINDLAGVSCLSRKQFERKFLNFIGISPRKYLNIIRFQSAIYNHSLKPHYSLTQIAYQSGYYDQSHFINEFRKLSGLTPRRFFEDCNTISDFFQT